MKLHMCRSMTVVFSDSWIYALAATEHSNRYIFIKNQVCCQSLLCRPTCI